MKTTCTDNLASRHYKVDSVPCCIHASATGAQAKCTACIINIASASAIAIIMATRVSIIVAIIAITVGRGEGR